MSKNNIQTDAVKLSRWLLDLDMSFQCWKRVIIAYKVRFLRSKPTTSVIDNLLVCILSNLDFRFWFFTSWITWLSACMVDSKWYIIFDVIWKGVLPTTPIEVDLVHQRATSCCEPLLIEKATPVISFRSPNRSLFTAAALRLVDNSEFVG